MPDEIHLGGNPAEARRVLAQLARRLESGWSIRGVRAGASASGGFVLDLEEGESVDPGSRAPEAAWGVAKDPGARPLRVLCLHGVNHLEDHAPSEGPWVEAIGTALRELGAPAPEVRWVRYNDLFRNADLNAAEVASAMVKLGAASVWHGLGDWFGVRATRGGRSLNDTLRWTAGMVVQWSENEALRARLRSVLRQALTARGWRPDLLLAHSLGSLIAYDTLARPANAGLCEGLTLVTFGSQIGHPSLRALFGGRIVPIPRLRRWYHLYNRNDHAFTAPLAVRFPSEDVARFHQCDCQFDLPDDALNHDATAYLAHRETRLTLWWHAAVEVAGAKARAHGALTRLPSGSKSVLPVARRAVARRFERALLVGISRYPQPESCLEGCVNDVFLMSELLQRRGFRAENVRVLLDERATAASIRDRLEWLLDGSDDQQDRVFYFAGHGAQIPGYGAHEVVDRRDECLVPYDFDWNDRRSAITDDWFAELYSQLPAGTRFLTLFDCCHSGGMTRQGGNRARGLIPPDDIRHRLLQWSGGGEGFTERRLGDVSLARERRRRKDLYGEQGDLRGLGRAVGIRLAPREFRRAKREFGHFGPYMPVILEACQEHELANEVRVGARSHGAFTWCLGEVLRQWPAGRALTWAALAERVAEALRERGYRQTPALVCPTQMRDMPVPWKPERRRR